MKMFYIMVISLALLFGCLGGEADTTNQSTSTPGTTAPDVTTTPQTNQTTDTSGTTSPPTTTQPTTTQPTQNQTTTTGSSGTDYTSTATSQADCATLTPDCDSCISKKGCGWCKSSASCFLGDASGPTVSSCPANDWATESSQCSIVSAGDDCSKLTNCADCLAGTGCQWCIQGSSCASESSGESCFGGWLENSYQCNYASR